MQRQIDGIVRWALNSWSTATLNDYAFLLACVVLVAYVISKATSLSTK